MNDRVVLTVIALHALDVVVALRIAESPRADFRTLAEDLALSVSTTHAAVKRLMLAGLVRPTGAGGRAVNRHALLEFLEHGVRYAFPAAAGALVPLLPRAGQLVKRAPATYALLTAVDALRVGRARERDIARRYLREVLKVPSPSQPSTV